MPNFIPYNQTQLMLLPLNIREMIPEDHLVHGISTLVERLDLSSIYQTYKNNEGGRPSYHPLMLIKVLFYAYAIGVRSSRKIAARLESDVFFMYLAAMQRPDFRTISDFRKDHLEELKELFQQIVVISMSLGIAKIGHISIDGTKMRASAGKRKTKSKESLDKLEQEIEKEIEKMLDEAEEVDEQEDRLYGDKRGDEMPKELRKKEDLIEKIEEAKKKLKERGWKEVNITDPDSRFMQDPDGGIDMGYNTQVAVDEETQVIVANDVTSEVNDHHQFIPLYEQVVDNTDKKPEEVSADCGYANGKNYMYIEDNKIDAYLPDQMFDKEVDKEGKEKLSRYDRRNFRYNKDKDTFTCPEGKILVYKQKQKKDGINSRIYVGQECSYCKQRVECTRGKARHVKVSEVDGIMERMRKKLLTDEGKERYKKRLSTVEPVFGNLKKNLGYRDFQLRGLEKVRGEFQLMCIAHNIKKIHKYVTSEDGGGFSAQEWQKTENHSSFLENIKGVVSEKIKTFLFRLIVPTTGFSRGEFVVI
ncbi:MAG: IS1182 family transposase [Candidatus Aminicenantes bacterium]|nr:IS1182 family transposase [Candidatus Aminicenantes bacterium]